MRSEIRFGTGGRTRRFHSCRTSKRIRHHSECGWNQTQTDRSATVTGASDAGDYAGKCRSRSAIGQGAWPNEIQRIDVVALCREYEQLRKAAPSRSARDKRYFVGHDGRPQAKNPGSPSEKHLAIALWRRKARWPRAGGGWMCLLDYQFPLKARRSDAGLGEVDLLGATDEGRSGGHRVESPAEEWLSGRHSTARSDGGTTLRRRRPRQHRAIAAEARDGFAINVSEEPRSCRSWPRRIGGAGGGTRPAAHAQLPGSGSRSSLTSQPS